MKVLVTGASGFLGKYVVAEALRRGYSVKAVIRPASDAAQLSWHDHPRVELVRLDLRQNKGLDEALQGVHTVIHLAATKSGDFYDQFAGTVIATENLLSAMVRTQVLNLVAISTFSVYDYLKIKPGTILNEDSPIESDPKYRDEYAQTKLIQEDLIREFQAQHQAIVTILRPGMIYGRECLWNACMGAEMGDNAWLLIGSRAQMPLTYVENCAEAIVNAIQCEAAIGQVINIVDDALPTQRQFKDELLKRTASPPKLRSISWTAMNLLSQTAWSVNQRFLKGQAKFPSILVPARLNARFRPLRYTNDRAKRLLQWTPRYSLAEALDRSYGQEDYLKVDAQIQELQSI